MTIENVGSKCCGCRACLQSCNLGAITFKTDEYGFEYPQINTKLCVLCGRCEAVCPILNHEQLENREPFGGGAARAKDKKARESGSSGGLFGVFAKKVICDGGVVFGAAFDEDMKLKTKLAQAEDELSPLYKSKYLLCDTNGAFSKIKTFLEEGTSVLYCASPCQILALKTFLGKDYLNLFLIDFVCHGVGSQTMFDESLKYYSKKTGQEIVNFTFREKSNKTAHYYSAVAKSGKKYHGFYFDFPYYNTFCKDLAFRDSCILCPFASETRVSDITIGDFHTIEKYLPEIDRADGISMFLCNTKKGKEFFDSIADSIDIFEFEPEILYKNNRFGNGVTEIPERTKIFRETFKKYGYSGETLKILSPRSDIIKKVFYHCPNFIRKFFRRFIGG